MVPFDGHVHSEWSWDALAGSMADTCARAAELGLPGLAFTDHADFTPWLLRPDERVPWQWRPLLAGRVLTPPPFDVDGYRRCLAECRDRFPGLRIRSGVELSEPHRYPERAADLLRRGGFDRVLAAVHSTPVPGGRSEYRDAFHYAAAAGQAVRDHLTETLRMIREFDGFEVLAHLDYPLRYWPTGEPVFDPFAFEEEHRAVLRELARSGRVLEFNTRVPMPAPLLTWWRAEGGRALSLGSDAHRPADLARLLPAAPTARAAGFRPPADPGGFWVAD